MERPRPRAASARSGKIFGGHFARVALRVLDTGAGADNLYIPGLDASFVAQAVLVRHDASSYIGDDLDIDMADAYRSRFGEQSSSSLRTYRLPTGLWSGLPNRPMAK